MENIINPGLPLAQFTAAELYGMTNGTGIGNFGQNSVSGKGFYGLINGLGNSDATGLFTGTQADSQQGYSNLLSLQSANDLEGINQGLRNISSFERVSAGAAYRASRLETAAASVSRLQTDYKNPISGVSETSDRTLGSFQVERLRSEITRTVATFNNALAAAGNLGNGVVSDTLKTNAPTLTDNLTSIGLKQNDDGTLSFSESTFDKSVTAGTTTIAGFKSTTKDLGTFSASLKSSLVTSSTISNNFGTTLGMELLNNNSNLSTYLALGGSSSTSSQGLSSYFGIGSQMNFFA